MPAIEPDCMRPFLMEHLHIRGELVHLDSTWREALQRRRYPPAIRSLLGEAMAAAALLTGTIKLEGRLNMQILSSGPLRSLVVQCSSDLGLRGLASWQEEPMGGDLQQLCPGAILAITLEPQRGHRYQGLVELAGSSLAGALEHYFAQSEQLPTWLTLAADEERAAGLLLQEQPGALRSGEDSWNRIASLAQTLTEQELLSLDAETMLRRLFADDDVRVFQAEPLSFRCSCSRERTVAVLLALGRADAEALLAEQGAVQMSCEFCGHPFRFDPVDVAAVFAGAGSVGPRSTRH
jgi:molecular chaperone Hsp33